jgi:hypothetical protein
MSSGLVIHGKGVGVIPGMSPAMKRAYMNEFGPLDGLPNGGRRIGLTNPNFAVPSDMSSSSASTALVDAVNNLISAYGTGVPSMHAYSTSAAAVQQAWMQDPIVVSAGLSARVDVDGGYGNNTHDIVVAINGSAPDVNTAAAPAGAPTVTTTPSTSTTTTTASTTILGMSPLAAALVGVAAAGGAYLVGKAVVKKHGHKVSGHARRLHSRLTHHVRRLHHASEKMY